MPPDGGLDGRPAPTYRRQAMPSALCMAPWASHRNPTAWYGGSGFPFSPWESCGDGNAHDVVLKRELEWKTLRRNGREWELTIIAKFPRTWVLCIPGSLPSERVLNFQHGWTAGRVGWHWACIFENVVTELSFFSVLIYNLCLLVKVFISTCIIMTYVLPVFGEIA